MKILKEKQAIYNQEPTNAIVTLNTIIPGISGKKINLQKSYNKMKGINSFQESLLVYETVKPSKSIKGIYDKVIVSGNPKIKRISIVTVNDEENFCFTTTLQVNKNCQKNNQHTILVEKITNNYLTKVKEKVRNGIIFYLETKNHSNELNLITKYLKNNNYEIVPVDQLIIE